jgi:hypothetical protein
MTLLRKTTLLTFLAILFLSGWRKASENDIELRRMRDCHDLTVRISRENRLGVVLAAMLLVGVAYFAFIHRMFKRGLLRVG